MPQIMNGGSMNIKVPGGSIYFDKTAYIDCGSDSAVGLDMKDYASGAISAWIKPATHVPEMGYIFAKRDADEHSYALGIYTNNKLVYVAQGFTQVSDDAVTLGEWQHVACVFHGDDVEFYINGESNGGGSPGHVLTQPDVPGIIGARWVDKDLGTQTLKFSGSMCDIQIWSGVKLTSNQIQQVYNGVDVEKNNRIARWLFNDKEGTTLTDSIGGYDGTLTNCEWQDRDITCWCKRWDEGNWDVTIETFLEPADRNYIMNNVTPGAYRELYNILGTPRYIDTTYSSGNTLILEPRSGFGINDLRQTRTIAVKNISDTFENWETFGLKIEGVRIDAGL